MDPSAPCPVPLDRSAAALRMECGALEAVIAHLQPADLQRPARHGWTTQLVLAHLVRSLTRLRQALTAPQPPDPQTSWLAYWSRHATEPATAARRARSFAASVNNRPVLRVWTEEWQSAVAEAAAAEPQRVLVTPRGSMRLDHFATTRVLEIVLSGLDLRHALDLEEVATPLALGVATAVLEGLLGRPRPDNLDDDVAFVLAATGRDWHPDPDLPVLG